MSAPETTPDQKADGINFLTIVRTGYRPAVVIVALALAVCVMAASGAGIVWRTHDNLDAKIGATVDTAIHGHVETERIVTDTMNHRLDEHDQQLREFRSAIGKLTGSIDAVNQNVSELRSDERKWHKGD